MILGDHCLFLGQVCMDLAYSYLWYLNATVHFWEMFAGMLLLPGQDLEVSVYF